MLFVQIRNFNKFFLTFIILVLSYSFGTFTLSQTKVVGYYPAWMTDTLPVNKIEFENLSYIIQAFAWPDTDGSIKVMDNLINPELNTAAHALGKKILVSFGGGGNATGFSATVADSVKMDRFISELVNFLSVNNYDGVDLDWEGPQNMVQGSQLTALVKGLRAKFNQVNPDWMITMAVPASNYSGQYFEYEKILNDIDWFAIMAYDFFGSWVSYAGHNAPLYQDPRYPQGSGSDALTYMNVKRHVPLNKLLLGMPFYGKLCDAPGLYRNLIDKNVIDYVYSDIMNLTSGNGWVYHWDNVSKVPYFTHDSTKFLTYDDTTSIKMKVQFSLIHKMGGVMIWALGQDLYQGRQPLLETIGNTINSFTSVRDETLAISGYKLYNNYPNPFNPSTIIQYAIGKLSNGKSSQFVTLKVYDILGQEVATLVNEDKSEGIYSVEFNIQQSTIHHQLSSGTYFYQLRAGNYIVTRKMLLMK